MAHLKGIAHAEGQEACKQWAAFQLRAQHEEAMKEWFKTERKSQRRKKQESGKAAPREPQAVKREPKVQEATAPKPSPVVVEHAITRVATDEIKPSSVVSSATKNGGSITTAPTLPADHGSAVHVATPIQFPLLSFNLKTSKERGPDRESAVLLKLLKEMEELKTELTTEKSNRMVAEQLLSIVQQDLAEQQLRVSTETTARVKVENELVFVKTDLKHTERVLKEKENAVEELKQELKMANSLVERMEEYSQAVKYSTGGVDHFLDMKLSTGRVAEAEKKLKVCQRELLHSQEEVQQLLDKMEELTQERGEMVSHRVHSHLLKISDERADEAERRVHELEAEVGFLRDQVEKAKQTGIHEEVKPLSLFSSSLAVSRPLFSSPYSSSALLTTSAPHSSIPTLDSFKFVSPYYEAEEFEHNRANRHSEAVGPAVRLQTSERERGVGGLPLATSAGLSAPTVGLHHGVQDDGLGAEHIGGKLHMGDAGLEGRVGVSAVSEQGGVGGGEVATDLPPIGELPDLDLLGEEGQVDEGGTKREKRSVHTVSILRVTGDSDGQDDDDDSSDWGSSSGDEGEGKGSSGDEGEGKGSSGDEGEGRGVVAPDLLPRFEALAPQEDGLSGSPMSERRRPPPIKPKPAHLQLWQADIDARPDMIYYEAPSSFDKPPSKPGLRSFPSFPKPVGPRGRRLPARYQMLFELPVTA